MNIVPEVWRNTEGNSNMLFMRMMLDGARVRQVRLKRKRPKIMKIIIRFLNSETTVTLQWEITCAISWMLIIGQNGKLNPSKNQKQNILLQVIMGNKWPWHSTNPFQERFPFFWISKTVQHFANLIWPLNWICITAIVNNLTFSVWLCYLDKWWAFFEHPHASMPNCPIAHHKTCVWKTRCCYILLELLLIGLSEYNSGSICRDITDGKKRTIIFGEDLGRWRKSEMALCHSLQIKEESFDLAPSFFLCVAHFNYRGGLEENRVSKYTLKRRQCGPLKEFSHF